MRQKKKEQGTGPQTEDGYLVLANELVDGFARTRIAGEEWQCLWVVIRKTYGWQDKQTGEPKKADNIALSQFSKMTGLKRSHVCRAISKLVAKRVLLVTKKGPRGISNYHLNKNFHTWKLVPKKGLVPKMVMGSPKKGNKVVPKKGHTNNTITNNIITNNKGILSGKPDGVSLEIINYLNEKLGTHYHPTTPKTADLISTRLQEGFTVDDFKTVIDNKLKEWGQDVEMSKYLRPITLFSNKFESYLNQPGVESRAREWGLPKTVDEIAREKDEAERKAKLPHIGKGYITG